MALDIFSYILGCTIEGGGGGKGGSIPFKSVTLNSDGSYDVVDNKDRSHTLSVVGGNGVPITAISYDDNSITLEYDDSGNLVKIGDSVVDVGTYPEPTIQRDGSFSAPFYSYISMNFTTYLS